MKSRFCGEDWWFQKIKMERLIKVMMLSALSSLLTDLTLSYRHLIVIQPVPWYQSGACLILVRREPKTFIPRECNSASLRERDYPGKVSRKTGLQSVGYQLSIPETTFHFLPKLPMSSINPPIHQHFQITVLLRNNAQENLTTLWFSSHF